MVSKSAATLLINKIPSYLNVLLWAALACLILGGCRTATPVSQTPVLQNTAAPTERPTAAVTPSVSTVNPLVENTLYFWLPPELADTIEIGEYIGQINQQFSREYPNLHLRQLPKALHGPGGMVNLLLTTQAVAPAQLPDVVVLDMAELAAIESAGLAHNPDAYLPDEFWDGVFPVMRKAVTWEQGHAAIPFVTDLLLMVYDDTAVKEAPATWSELGTAKARYVFPAAKGDGSSADTFMLHYYALGGTLNDDLQFNTRVATQVLRYYRTYYEMGVLPDSIRELATYDECWEAYASGDAVMTNILYSEYDIKRPYLTRSHYAAIPMMGDKPGTMAHGLAWIIITNDAEKQELATRYIEMTLQPEALASWASSQHLLPARMDTLSYVLDDHAFQSFIESQLFFAFAYPDIVSYTKIQDIISQAIEDVLSGTETPERAAANMTQAISMLR